MRKPLLVILLLFASINILFAGHFRGHDVSIVNIKDPNGLATNYYKIRVKLYNGNIGSPSGSLTGYVYNKVLNTLDTTLNLSKIGASNLVTYPKEDCYLEAANLRVVFSVYESGVFHSSAFPSLSEYVFISLSHTNFISGLTNISDNSASHYAYMEFKGLSNESKNSSPEFKKNPADVYCIGKIHHIDWDIDDADGDSLVYSIVPTINVSGSIPFSGIPFKSGYGINLNVMDGSPDINISSNGILNFMPTIIGTYLVTVKVEDYRKIGGVPTKLSEVRRDLIFNTTVCDIRPPSVSNNLNNQKGIIIDTLIINEDYNIIFTANDAPEDSLQTTIIPRISPGENLLDPNVFGALWGKPGQLNGGQFAQNLVIEGVGSTMSQFKWKPKCSHVRNEPYFFTIVTRDNNCPDPYYDSTKVYLYVKKKPNNAPMFVLPSIVKKDENVVLRYNLAKNEVFSLSGANAITAIDADSNNTVYIRMVADPANGSLFNNMLIFSSFSGLVNSTANLTFTAYCSLNRPEPYKVYIEAYDNDCYKSDTTRFTIEFYINENVLTPPSICAVSVDFSSTFNIIYWNDIMNVDLNYYIIYRENLSTGSYDSIGKVEKAAVLKYNDMGFNPTKELRYKIAASSHCGVKTVPSNTHSNVILKIMKVNNNLNLLSWNLIQGAQAEKHKLYRSINNAPYVLVAELPNTATSILDTTVIVGTAEYILEVVRNEVCYTVSPSPNFSVYSNSVTTNITSAEMLTKDRFRIYPNPTNETITIDNLDQLTAEYILMDIHGKEIARDKFMGQHSISLVNYPAGVYLIHIISNSNTYTERIMKN
jgi:hypothetical protein